jgi:uncharacterized alpha-E superfamily protein
MLSRVADNLYWMSRYLERAEHTTRLTGVHLNLMLEHDLTPSDRRWTRVLTCLGSKDAIEGDPFHAAQLYALDQIMNSIAAARENARQVREQISSEVWEELNRLYHETKRIGTAEQFEAQPFELVYNVTQSSHLFAGLTDSTMLRGEGWQFIQAGRYMERVHQIARLIDSHFEEFFGSEAESMSGSEHIEWIGLLRSCTAFEAYCKVYTAEMRPERVAEFLLLNPEFPHALRFGADRLSRSLEAVREATGRKSDRLTQLAGRMTSALSYTPLEEIIGNMHEFSANIRKLCGQIHSSIHQVYIAYPVEAAIGA